MRKIRCNTCGSENEVPDEGELPRCGACDGSLRTGTWLNEEADETDSGPVETPDEAQPPPQEPCSCEDAGGPTPDDPTTCFLCGGVLPPNDAPAVVPSPPAVEPEPKTISCSLILADGRRVPVAEGILVTRDDPASVASPHIVNVSTPTVSRKHAWLGVRGQNVEIVDLNSTNGTYINGMRIESLLPVEVAPTEVVQISFGRNLRATLAFD